MADRTTIMLKTTPEYKQMILRACVLEAPGTPPNMTHWLIQQATRRLRELGLVPEAKETRDN